MDSRSIKYLDEVFHAAQSYWKSKNEKLVPSSGGSQSKSIELVPSSSGSQSKSIELVPSSSGSQSKSMEDLGGSQSKSVEDLSQKSACLQRAHQPSLKGKLSSLPKVDPLFRPSLYKIPSYKVDKMKNELTPTVIGLGVFHGKLDSHFQKMKLHYLNEFLNSGKKPIEIYLEELEKIERQIRNFYFPQPDIPKVQLLETMMEDGAFLLGLFMKHDECLNSSQIPDPYKYIPRHVMRTLKRDLLKYENQIPFEVVQLLWGIQKGTEPDSLAKLHKICMDFFDFEVPGILHHSAETIPKHLLEIYYSNFIILHPHTINTPSAVVTIEPGVQVPNNQTFTLVPTATNLKEYGVKFNRSSRGNEICVEFSEKTMGLPFFKIDDMKRCILANFVVYEQVYGGPKPIGALCSFLSSLMRDEKDVNVLAKKGIIENTSGNDKDVAEFFSHACLDVEIETSYLETVIECVNHHFYSQLKRWWGTFMVEFFELPGSIPVFIYGIISVLINIIRFVWQILDRTRK